MKIYSQCIATLNYIQVCDPCWLKRYRSAEKKSMHFTSNCASKASNLIWIRGLWDKSPNKTSFKEMEVLPHNQIWKENVSCEVWTHKVMYWLLWHDLNVWSMWNSASNYFQGQTPFSMSFPPAQDTKGNMWNQSRNTIWKRKQIFNVCSLFPLW